MIELGCLALKTVFMAVYLVALLVVFCISIIYFVLYLYDSIFGDWIYQLGKYVANHYPTIRNNMIIKKIKRIMKPKEKYMRYETPMCTYCCSFTAIVVIYEPLQQMGIQGGFLIAFISYIVAYFFGMYRKYKNEELYSNVLNNNLLFLKLSFVPLTFIITIVGFLFTIGGMNIRDIDFDYILEGVRTIIENPLIQDDEIWMFIIDGLKILIMFYVLSLPMQIVSYYIILVINYFRRYGKFYGELVKSCTHIFISLVKN